MIYAVLFQVVVFPGKSPFRTLFLLSTTVDLADLDFDKRISEIKTHSMCYWT